MKTNPASKSPALRRFFFALLFCVTAAALWATLGNYPPTTVQLSGNTTVTPDAAPTNTVRMNVASSTNFKGRLEGSPTTGVLRITNAHPAGTHPVTVTGFDSSGIPSTASFTLTVTTPAGCNPVNFTPPADFPAGQNPRSVAIGDFNGDGDQDLVTASGPANVSVLLGDGTGSFGAAANFDVSGNTPQAVAVGDFNGDFNQDLATANAGSGNVSVLLGNGAGGFAPPTSFNVGAQPRSVAVGDFNGDGMLDLVAANENSANISVLLGNGMGGFAVATNFNAGPNPYAVAIGSFNSDGTQDLAVTNRGPANTVSIMLGNGMGAFTGPAPFNVGNDPISVAVGDFNGNGIQDLATANQASGDASVSLGTGTGTFGTAVPFAADTAPQAVAVGDFNGDTLQDLAVANGADTASVLLGNGAGSFSAATNFRVGDGPSALAVGDFNGDGMQDIVTSNLNINSVSVLLRICPPAFAIDSVTQNEGAPGVPTSFVFTVTKTGLTSLTTTVDFMTQDGTATLADNDYEFSSGTLTFASDQPTATIAVTVNGDATFEPNEVFTVHLSNPGNATISTADGTGTITNDDAQPVTPTPTPTATPTPTPTPTPTATPTTTPTPTPSPSATASPSVPPPASPTPTAPPPAQAVNFSTRMRVGTGDRVAIGGFIITGNAPKEVIIRAIGPSLRQFGIVDALADPVLELHGPGGFATITNNNWRDTQEDELQNTGIAPTNDFESAIVASLNPGTYTGVVRGNGNTSGIGLVEVYDLDQGAASKLANISTRAFVGIGSDIMIAGFMLGNAGGDDNVIIRGLGPSLTAAGVPNVLANPTLELRDSNGTLLVTNDDWQDDPVQAAIIAAAGLAPGNVAESAIAVTLAPDLYTALFAGLNCTTGNGLVEVYDRGLAGNRMAMPAPIALPVCGPIPTPTPTPTPPPTGSCIENFDGVVAPALPAGWVATNAAGSAALWATSPTTPDTPPNDAFVKDAPEISDKRLDSRNITITSASAQLSFRNNFDLQDGFDGGVLEVSSPNIAGGAFTDITNQAVGGSFVSGGYTDTISLAFGSPIAGRMAWSGDSGGYINTVVNLGPNVNGQTIKLRFRLGTDTALGNAGWRIDTISIAGGACP